MGLPERIATRIAPEPNTGCWLWLGSYSHNGYGQVWFNGGNLRAHRVFWEDENGPIPDGLELDHLCKVRCCVNPAHLEAVTRKENIRRSEAGLERGRQQMAKKRCPRGHEYSGENLYRYADGHRACRACRRAAQNRYHQKRNQKDAI
jgi:hypothetical protein